jgi:uncharacterized protein YfiM (DUF2279 family)
MKKIGIIVFIAALIVGVTVANLFSFGRTSAKFFNISINRGVSGSGNVVSEKRNVADFKAIEVGGVFEVEVVAQKEFSVEIEADDNLLQFIKTEVNGETLEIKTVQRFSTKNPIRLRISAPTSKNSMFREPRKSRWTISKTILCALNRAALRKSRPRRNA